MKKSILISSLIALSCYSYGQVKTPQASLAGKIEQVVGLTDVEVEYVRPAKKEREIFGNLVPYGRLWRTGANENTTIEFSEDIVISEKTLPKGKYALYSKPEANQWTIFFYKDNKNWGLPKVWNEAQVALQTRVTPSEYPIQTEYFTIEVTPIDNDNGVINLIWDKTLVQIPFKTFTHQQALASIEQELNEKSTSRDYFNAGTYYFTSKEDVNKALEYVDKAISMEQDVPYYMLRQKSLILAKLGKRREAIKVAEESLKKAQAAGNTDYVKLNQDSINEWKR